jgi:hypothetical protein
MSATMHGVIGVVTRGTPTLSSACAGIPAYAAVTVVMSGRIAVFLAKIPHAGAQHNQISDLDF